MTYRGALVIALAALAGGYIIGQTTTKPEEKKLEKKLEKIKQIVLAKT